MTLFSMTRQTGMILLDDQEVPYLWLRSPRRKQMALRVTENGEVEVRSPMRLGQRRVEAFIQEHGSWLQLRRASMLNVRQQRPRLVDGMQLPLLDQTLTLRIQSEEATRIRLVQDELLVPQPLTPGSLESMLERWYRCRARIYLSTRLVERSREMGVTVQKLTIRGQKSRWGSCSSSGGINLNWQLMFHPARVVEYVIVHELCHRIHMNHSPEFWSKVKSLLPDYLMLRKQLKTIKTPWYVGA